MLIAIIVLLIVLEIIQAVYVIVARENLRYGKEMLDDARKSRDHWQAEYARIDGRLDDFKVKHNALKNKITEVIDES